jgi:hypothetical protein
MSGRHDRSAGNWHQIVNRYGNEITPNERFWLEVIRLASWDSDPVPTLEKVQKLRMIFQTRP